MREWINENFELVKDGHLNEETWKYEDEFMFEFNEKEMGSTVEMFIEIFGSEKPMTAKHLKSKVKKGQWHVIFDSWKDKGILS